MCQIRDVIAAEQRGTAPKIFAQKPEYCAAGISHIVEHFNMCVLEDPEGFKALDGRTFVLSFAPNVPVRQIVLGLTHEFGGPAGLFCDDIGSDGLECNDKGIYNDNGRVTCLFHTCEPSPALWRFKQESFWMEYGDRDKGDWFGNVGVYLKKSV